MVFSRPGREEMTAQTIEQVDGHGGASTLPSKELFWVGTTPPPKVPDGWVQLWFKREPAGAVRDFWSLLTVARDGADLIVLEDDVQPCRNALPYMARWDRDLFTSFFNGRRRPLGPEPIGPNGFTLSQAIKIPSRLVEALRLERPEQFRYRDHDITLGAFLKLWSEPVYYHRSLVQHVGRLSVGGKRGRPIANDFVGVDYDALAAADGQRGP